MRNVDGLQPQEAFDELLKYLFYKESQESTQSELHSNKAELQSDGTFAHSVKSEASHIKASFANFLKGHDGWADYLWTDRKFQLSDKALFGINELFESVNIRAIPFDIRSAALKEFMPPEVRKGLGIYTTPDSVVKAIIEAVEPPTNAKVLDPACGSGTFLIETLKFWNKTATEDTKLQVWGADKNPRMMLLSELNLCNTEQVNFNRKLADSLFSLAKKHSDTDDFSPNSFDYVFTNPPFGVYLDNKLNDLSLYETCKSTTGEPVTRQQSELVFIEQSLRLLKPGGTLGIVLPKSVVTNIVDRVAQARKAIDKLGHVYGVIQLPPETFSSTGTQTTTVVLLMKKYLEDEDRSSNIGIALAEIKNVGFDSTGRPRAGEDLTVSIQHLRKTIATGKESGNCRLLSNVPKDSSLSTLQKLLNESAPSSDGSTLTLRDVAELITTGRTPPRINYTDEGLFVVKVGNLKGAGIDWNARDRNFVNQAEKVKRMKTQLMLKQGDIVLTSSAHSSVYIAKKVDIISQIPDWVGGSASLVGEVMLVRPKEGVVDPYLLLAFLRASSTMETIQKMVRGQTAHLHPTDMYNLAIPEVLLKPTDTLLKAAEFLRKESELSAQMNELSHNQQVALTECFP